jgi:ribosomal protein S27AE
MKPEWHISCIEDGCYQAGVKEAKEDGMYIKGSISKDDIGHLLQGKHITLLFLNDDYEQEARLDIGLTNEKTNFSVSNKLNDLIITEDKSVKHGHWTLLDDCSNDGVYCSVCHKKVYKTDYANQKIKSKYCPNCGSIMDEEFEKL